MIFDAPTNLPVEDILEKSEPSPPPPPRSATPTVPPPPPRPIPGTPPPPEAIARIEEPRTGFKRIALFVGVIVVILAVVGAVGWYTLSKLKSSETVPVVETPVEIPAPTPTPAPEPTPAPAPAPEPAPAPATPTDSDSDGLTDEEEARFGTDPLKADTDGDGLFDREEINFYRTDPKNPDTDGDGFSDGTEVRNNYNPLGPGRLGTIPQP